MFRPIENGTVTQPRSPETPRAFGPGVSLSVVETIGRTPLVALERLSAGLPGTVLAKLESFSPGHSVKDRIARRMVEEAEREGRLQPGSAIVELTSGNTGIGLALVSAVRGYRFYAVMSEGNSVERQRILRSLGAEVVLVPQAQGFRAGVVTGEDLELVEQRAAELARDLGAFRPAQFGRVHAWVASVGTGGTFTGVAQALKTRCPAVRCIAAEPASARRLAGGEITSTSHQIQGTGYNLVPPTWDPAVCDGFIGVTDDDAVETARLLGTREGICGGYSSGANVWAALQLAREASEGEVIVTVCPDTGLKYLSTELFP
ncbi:MAG: Pyridoxal-5-phosphate-dependent protein beta subunit [Armatimonadetes bacterium]|nr:Pyridoxal-5-phosphate-dependent protein beta subunit [Armatimonadota bacterium]